MEPYATLVALAREELELVVAGRFDALEDLHERRSALMASLPAADPAAAAEQIAEAATLQQQITEALAVARAGADSALDRLVAGRTTVEGYRLSTGAQAPTAQADYRS